MKFVVSAILIAFIVSGCNTLPTEATDQGSISRTVKKADGSSETTSNKSDYATYLEKAVESKPLFEMSCPPTGCIIASLKVNAPSDTSKIAAPPGPPETMGASFIKGVFGLANNAMDKAAGIAPWYFGASVLKTGFDKANSSVDNSNRSVDNSNRSTDSSNRSTTTTTTTRTDNSNRSVDNSNRSVNNSNNRNCQTGAPAGTTGQAGSSGPATC